MKTQILIIDNEARWIEFAKRDLEAFEIVVAGTPQDAASELEQNDFDLVIANAWNLDILRLISERFSDRRFVVTTVRPSVDEALKAYRFGAADYFPKSFNQKSLFNQVKGILSD
jgi:two-component system OmpR family response regulator